MAGESKEQTIGRLGRAKNWIANNWFYSILIVIGGIIILLMVIFPNAFPTWFGLGEIKNDAGEIIRAEKTVWDWLDLLIVPTMLAAGAAWIAQSQQKRELEEREVDREIAEQARKAEQEIAEKAREADREIAKDRQEQITLENYYDRMAELLLTHNLREKTGDDDEERSIARARTLTVLRSLNSTRKGQVLRFLHESRLIDLPRSVIVLRAADLNGADLGGADLIGADLSRADLGGADLNGARLSRARLSKANLNGANLIGARLIRARLSGASLSGADLRGAHLSEAASSWANLSAADLREADLIGADLSGADLRRANLSEANLNRANLSGADLRGAVLSWASLVKANLGRAHLRGADLRGADLSEADLSEADLRRCVLNNARYATFTKWPANFDVEATGAILIDDFIKNLDESE